MAQNDHGGTAMTLLVSTIERNPKAVAAVLGAVIVFFLASCLLHDLIPICHWVFRCDHRMH
jgi:Na+/H+ antiporter NhaD/arsenite permease-like protein